MYEFSFGAFILGIIIIIASGVLVLFHQKFADNLGSGVSSYERFKLAGLIGCGIGFMIMTSLHSIPLNMLVDMVFNR